MKEPVWIDERDALTLHDRLLVLHGGASGIRDQTFTAREEDAAQAVLSLATGTMDERAFAAWLRANVKA